MAKKKLVPRLGKDINTLFTRKAGAIVRKKPRNNKRIIEQTKEEY